MLAKELKVKTKKTKNTTPEKQNQPHLSDPQKKPAIKVIPKRTLL